MTPSPPSESSLSAHAARWLLAVVAAAIPVTLLWDYSWESTVGIDSVWAAPHTANYLAVAAAALAAVALIFLTGRARAGGVRLGKLRAPLGAWLALWGSFAFGTAFLFDRWWQASYGLQAGIWHPPQLLKAVAFFAIAIGAWLACAAARERSAAILASGAILALIFMVTLAANFANRQHSAIFYQLACGTYPLVLVACAFAGPWRFSATAAALAGTALVAALVWIMPLCAGSPQVAPIYHPRTSLLPPPFPPLLLVPALALDALLRLFPGSRKTARPPGWGQAVEAGLIFFILFLAVQWPFARFLLSPAADHWFFAGGGKQWPFFLRIDPSAQTAFWNLPGQEMTLARSLAAAALAVIAARLGLWLGAAMNRLQR